MKLSFALLADREAYPSVASGRMRNARRKIRSRTGLAKTVLFMKQTNKRAEFSSNIKITVP